MRRFRGLLWIVLPLAAIAGLTAFRASPGTFGAPTSRSAPTGPGRVPTGCHARGRGLYVEPDRRCSPGATNPAVTQGTIRGTICKSGWTKTIRPPESVTGPEKREVMRAYGISGSTHGYELDHIISLELGGAANSYRNYWPEPNYPDARGFYLNPKDKLENALKHRICDGKMSLRAAQHLISTNWAAAYGRYG